MAIMGLHMLSLCMIGRKEGPKVNRLKWTRKSLKSIWGTVDAGNATIMAGKGAVWKIAESTFDTPADFPDPARSGSWFRRRIHGQEPRWIDLRRLPH
jgi:hypothetical protein